MKEPVSQANVSNFSTSWVVSVGCSATLPHAAHSVATGQASKPSTITYIPALPALLMDVFVVDLSEC